MEYAARNPMEACNSITAPLANNKGCFYMTPLCT